MTVVTAPAGAWRGARHGRTYVFHGIRYAEADRFEPPRRPAPHQGVLDAVSPGPAAPQTPSRLEGVMGAPAPVPQSEDCLRLTVTTPRPGPARPRPVLVWLHGGAYLSGSGEWNLYDAERLSAEGDLVVVSVGYRLGALGYLRAPGVCDGNLGLRDQIAGLEWVRDNIAAFGGDPERVTVAGQSAGAHSIAALLGIPGAGQGVERVILQSAPLGLDFAPPGAAERVGALFLRELAAELGPDRRPLAPGTHRGRRQPTARTSRGPDRGLPSTPAPDEDAPAGPHVDARGAPLPAVLAAQARTARRLAGRLGLNSAPPFLPVAGVGPLPPRIAWHENLIRRARTGRLDVLIGTTRDEARAFYGRHHPVLSRVRRLPAAGDALADRFERAVQQRVFDAPTWRLADLLAASGARTYRYLLDPLAPGAPFGACHCLELPLLFGAPEDWATAPMLAGTDPALIEAAGARMRARWSRFVHTGSPGPDPGPASAPDPTADADLDAYAGEGGHEARHEPGSRTPIRLP
ncbi:carboxylesterase family protein [Streptomyces sp. G45]|uniref:carboxylesterase family protein n=1 Tax=Streptomyces sp. G45 TaxID=3406627 RepID=UPI003C16E190